MIHIISPTEATSDNSTVSKQTMNEFSSQLPFLSEDESSTSAASSSHNTVVSTPRRKSNEPLPADFKLSDYTVIIGRGKESKQNIGNKRLRVIASSFLSQYSEANDKPTKTKVVSKVIDMIHQAPGGMFIKKDRDSGLWHEVSDIVAREKVGYTFRDLLADKYKSSSKSKVARRMEAVAERAQRNFKRFDLAMQEAFPISNTNTNTNTSTTKKNTKRSNNHIAEALAITSSDDIIPMTISFNASPSSSVHIVNEIDEMMGMFHPLDNDVEFEALMQAPLLQY